jgi:hypothetical protein
VNTRERREQPVNTSLRQYLHCRNVRPAHSPPEGLLFFLDKKATKKIK